MVSPSNAPGPQNKITMTPAAQPKFTAIGPAVVPLLAIAVFINYVDRGNLATAAPLIKDQLHLSSTQIGVLVSAFFWSYVPAQILVGWVADRINPYRTLAIGLALWSIATALSGVATGFAMLISLRLLLGLGESAAFPCSSKLLAQHLSSDKLGAANGLIGVGIALGPALGTFGGGLLMAQIGWRYVFIVFGLVSLLWLVPWYASTRHAYVHADHGAADLGPSLTSIIRRREMWGAGLGQFCNNYAFNFVISWLPLYLVKARGLSIGQMAELAGSIYIVFAASSMLAGWLSDRWIRGGASDNRVRKTVIISGHAIMAATLVVAALGDLRVSVVSLFCAGVAFGFNAPTLFAIGQTLAGPQVAGKWMGIQNGVASLGSIVTPIITGLVIDITGQYYWAFIIAAAVATAGIIGWGLVIRKVEPLDWAPVIEPTVATARNPT
jgi:MFS family permease